jgi:hypothetical protein
MFILPCDAHIWYDKVYFFFTDDVSGFIPYSVDEAHLDE